MFAERPQQLKREEAYAAAGSTAFASSPAAPRSERPTTSVARC